MKVRLSELEQLSREILKKYGFNKAESDAGIAMMRYAQLRGNDHGFVRLFSYNAQKDKRAGKIMITKNTRVSTIIDGARNSAVVVMQYITNEAIKKAKKTGFAITASNNTFASSGAIGFYAKQLAESNLIGIAFSSCDAYVAPFGSSSPKLGANPISIAIPSKKGPIVFDMSSSILTWHDLTHARIANKKLPKDIAYDKKGNPTQDPNEVVTNGAVKVYDKGHRGSGFSFMIEALTGPLVGAAAFGIVDPKADWGNLIIAIDPTLLVDLDEFQKNTQLLIKRIKSGRKLPGVKEIYIPGERGNLLTQKQLKSGEVEIEKAVYEKMVETAQGNEQ